MPMQPTVRNFITSLRSFLTQLDMKLSVRQPNIYRLGHFLKAADEVETEMSGQLDSSSREALEELTASIARNFEDFPPRRKIFKQIREYIEGGKLPSYGGVKEKRKKGATMAAAKIGAKRKILMRSPFLRFVDIGHILLLEPTAEGIEEAKELIERRSVSQNRPGGTEVDLSEMLEWAMGNGWSYVRPEDIGALTDATIISQDGSISDDGVWRPHPDVKKPAVYAFMNYAVEDPVQTWAEGGTVKFVKSALGATKHPQPIWPKFFDAYITAALWSSTDEAGRPLEDNYGPDDIDQASVDKAITEVNDFVKGNEKDLVDAQNFITEAQLGHDFWLTREGHGSGFWDEGMGELGDRLTKAAKIYGEGNIYVGDDGKLHFM